MSDRERQRLENVLLWLRTAKETLPALNNAAVTADRLAVASALIDRMHVLAKALAARTRDAAGRRAA